jgi:cytidylate kinase
MALVTLSASYGAGGSVVGHRLAERLGVPFVDRAIPVQVAERLEVSVDDAEAHDEQTPDSFLDRLLRGFIGTDIGVPAPLPPASFTSEDFRRATEEVLLRQAATGEGVILGRAGMVVLRRDPRVLRVRLTGSSERRVRQAMEIGGVDERTATDALTRLDRAQSDYVRQFYGADIHDCGLYHLVIDSTTVPLDVCVELIAHAAAWLSAAEGSP